MAEPHPSPRAKRKEKLLWITSLLLAFLVMCSGCGFFFAVGLMSRGELTATVLGADLRLWRIADQRNVGLGFDRVFEFRETYSTCSQHYITLLLWKPELSIENLSYDNCH